MVDIWGAPTKGDTVYPTAAGFLSYLVPILKKFYLFLIHVTTFYKGAFPFYRSIHYAHVCTTIYIIIFVSPQKGHRISGIAIMLT